MPDTALVPYVSTVDRSDVDAATIKGLRADIRRLQDEVEDARRKEDRAKRDAAMALGNLRSQLLPLFRALQAVFGELDAVDLGVDSAPSVGTPSTREQAIWDQWKQRLPGYPAKIIEALQLQRDMNTSQLAIAVGCRNQRISEAIVKLNKAGLIDKNGGRFSLKSLA